MIGDNIVPVLSNDSPVSETDLFTYIDSKDYHTIINPDTLPRSLRSGGIFLCLGGEGDVIINGHKYHLTAGTLCFAFKGTIIQALDMGDDFKSYTLAINTDFLRELNIPSASSIQMMMREHPCVTLTRKQLDDILEISKMMHDKDQNTSHPYHEQINKHMLMLLCYELAAIYTHDMLVKHEPCSRQDILFREFLSLLATDITISREVQYYADKLCITPKYLTIITRQVSDRSAAAWITRTVILNAKALLSSTQLSVQQISARLNFPNPSFFGQYFLRHTGLTPKEYRRQKM